MANLDESRLDACLAADELPAPPPAVLDRAIRALRDRHQPSADARQTWLARLAQVRNEFRTVLSQPQFASLALACRGEAGTVIETTGGFVGDADVALGHAVQGNNVRGQVFLTALESPADLEVLLLAESGEVIERTTSDPIGRFRFLGLEPATYRLAVPDLGLTQTVELRSQ